LPHHDIRPSDSSVEINQAYMRVSRDSLALCLSTY